MSALLALALGRQVGDGALGHLGREADRLRQRRVRVDRERDVLRVGAHLDREHGLGDQLAGVGADDARAEDAVGLGLEQELRQPVGAADGRARGRTRPTGRRRSRPSMPSALAWVSVRPDPGDLGVGVGDRRDRADVERDVLARRSPRPRPCASCVALWASIGSPTTSPIAKMCGTLVRICSSTAMKPRSSTSTPAASAPIALPLGLRPTATRIAVEDLGCRVAPNLTRQAVLAGLDLLHLGLEVDRLVALLDALAQRRTRSLSAPGISWSSSSTTVTFEPSAS